MAISKLTGFDNWVLTEALKLFSVEAESQVAKAEEQGKKLIYAPGYFSDVANSLKIKVDSLTLKKQLND
jgi:Ni,Fe-hydrogenase I large subunit